MPKQVFVLGWFILVALLFETLTSIFWTSLSKEFGEIVWSTGQDLGELAGFMIAKAYYDLQDRNNKCIRLFRYGVIFGLDMSIVCTVNDVFLSPFKIHLMNFINLYIATFFLLYRVFGVHKYVVIVCKYLKNLLIKQYNKIRDRIC